MADTKNIKVQKRNTAAENEAIKLAADKDAVLRQLIIDYPDTPPAELADIVEEQFRQRDIVDVGKTMVTNAPKLLNILDTPDAVVRMALLNPNSFKEYASRLGSAKGWESVITEGWPEAEKLVEDAKTDNLVSLLRKAYPKETDVQIIDRLKKLTPEEKEKLYLDAPRLSSDGLTGAAVVYDLLQGGDEGHPYRKAAVNFLTNSWLGYGPAWGAAKGTFKAARRGKGLLKGLAPKVPANIEEQILKEAAEGEKQGFIQTAIENPSAVLGYLPNLAAKKVFQRMFKTVDDAVAGGYAGTLKGDVERPSEVAWKYGQLTKSPESWEDTIQKIEDVRKPLEEKAIKEGTQVDVTPIREKATKVADDFYREQAPDEVAKVAAAKEKIAARTKTPKVMDMNEYIRVRMKDQMEMEALLRKEWEAKHMAGYQPSIFPYEAPQVTISTPVKGTFKVPTPIVTKGSVPKPKKGQLPLQGGLPYRKGKDLYKKGNIVVTPSVEKQATVGVVPTVVDDITPQLEFNAMEPTLPRMSFEEFKKSKGFALKTPEEIVAEVKSNPMVFEQGFMKESGKMDIPTINREIGTIKAETPSTSYINAQNPPMEPVKRVVNKEMEMGFREAKNKALGGDYQQTGKDLQSAIQATKKSSPISMTSIANDMARSRGFGKWVGDLGTNTLTIGTGLYNRARKANPAAIDQLLREGVIQVGGMRSEEMMSKRKKKGE